MFMRDPKLRGVGELHPIGPVEMSEWVKCKLDFIYWAENYAKVTTLTGGFEQIKFRPYQLRMMKRIPNLISMGKRGMVVLAPRQCGKTTGFQLYITWYIIFHDYATCAIVSNKISNAKKVLRSIKQTYRALPLWMQKGIPLGGWSKESLELENESKIMVGSAQSESIRGNTLSCVSGKSVVTIRDRITKEDKTITMCELAELSEHTISDNSVTGKQNRFQVLTPKGFKDYDFIKKTIGMEVMSINGLVMTPDHLVMGDDGWKEAWTFCVGDSIHTDNGVVKINEIKDFVGVEDVYDLVNVKDTRSFFVDNILVHNCIYLDEYAFIPKHSADDFDNQVIPSIMSGGNALIFATSTPKGRNHFYTMVKNAQRPDSLFFFEEIKWQEVPNYTEEFKRKIIATKSVRFWSQEYDCVEYNSMITIRDTLTGKVEQIKLGEFYEKIERENSMC